MVAITGVWLRRRDGRVEVLVEVPGRGWVIPITSTGAALEVIVDGDTSGNWPRDPASAPPRGR
jgi:hypothetical protein